MVFLLQCSIVGFKKNFTYWYSSKLRERDSRLEHDSALDLSKQSQSFYRYPKVLDPSIYQSKASFAELLIW